MLSAIKKSVATKEIFTLSSATLFAQLVSFSLYPLLTRLYDPSSLGALALVLSIVSILAILAPFQLDQILLFSPKYEEVPIATASLFVVVTAFTLMSWVLILFLKFIEFATLSQIAWWPLLLLPLFLFPTALLRYYQSAAVREKCFPAIAISSSSSLVFTAVLKILLGFIRANLFSLLLSEFIYYWLSLFSLLGLARKQLKSYFSFANLKSISVYLKSYQSFILSAQLASLFTALNAYLPVHYVAALYDSEQIGFFAFAAGLVLALSRNLAQAILQVFSHRFSLYVRTQNTTAAHQVLQKTLFRGFAFGFPLALIAFWIVPTLFPIVFGQKWAPAGDLIIPLMLIFLFNLLNLPCTAALRIMERPGVNLASEISVTAGNLAVLAWALRNPMILTHYLWSVGLLQLVIAMIFSLIALKISKKRITN